MIYQERESFTHRLAKELLAKRLSSLEEADDYCCFNGLTWRRNYGVFTELKFYETSDPYYFECSDGLLPVQEREGKDPLDWFDKSYDRGRILFVPDITIFHKGTAAILIEVVETNSVSPQKLEEIQRFYSGHYVGLYEVSARQILSNITPELKKCDFKVLLG